MSSVHHLLRTRAAHQHHRVTFVELFFDLVFVFAVTQLAHTLIEHFTPESILHTLLLLAAVWWLWVYTAWATNWLDPDRLPVRLMLFVIMVSSLVLAASIPHAFGARGLYFAAAYSLTQVGRTLFTIWALDNQPATLRRNFQRVLVWLLVAAIFWFAGALAPGNARFALWALALAIEYAAPAAGFWVPGWGRALTYDWMVEGRHLAERCGLFVLIALGESILATGGAFSTLDWTSPTVVAFVTSFVGSIALWWLYFDTTADAGSAAIAESDDPGRLGRFAYTYLHIFIVAGIIVSAVADEVVLAHPTGRSELQVTITVLGGPALYLTGTLLFEWTIKGNVSRSHGCGLVALLLAIPLAALFAPLGLLIAATVVLLAVAVWDGRVRRVRPAPHLAGGSTRQV